MQKVQIPKAKRVFDVIVSIILIFILSPFIFFVLFLMLLENIFVAPSRGPIFYKEPRISQDEPFLIYKFRIFKMESLESIAKTKGYIDTKTLEQDKSNLTLTGWFLKKIYMDELPQFINVLCGEMSIVGPRPTNVKNYEKGLASGKYSRKLIKAGVTGYYQTHKASELERDQEQLDMAYVEFCKNNPGWKVVLYDLKIILMTIWAVLKAEGL